MKNPQRLAFVLLLCTSSCVRSGSSRFLATFNPTATLNQIATNGISYDNGSSGTSSSAGLFNGTRIEKDWSITFNGSHDQLLDQLDRFRSQIERQLSATGATISGRGKWSGNFSGFSFEYDSNAIKGFVRITGVSFESGRQGIEILVYEH